jgi:hypothetical protein
MIKRQTRSALVRVCVATVRRTRACGGEEREGDYRATTAPSTPTGGAGGDLAPSRVSLLLCSCDGLHAHPITHTHTHTHTQALSLFNASVSLRTQTRTA